MVFKEDTENNNFAEFHLAFLSCFSFSFNILIRTFLMQASFLNFSIKTLFAKVLGWLQRALGLGISIEIRSGSERTKKLYDGYNTILLYYYDKYF